MDLDKDLFNPARVPPEAEMPLEIQAAPDWTEHFYFWSYDPVAEHGIFVHFGRTFPDRSIWRAIIQIYVPGQQLLIAKIHGRDGDQLGPGAGPLKLNCIEPHRLWSVHFDGTAARVPREELMAQLITDKPVEPVRFSLLFEGAAPNFGRHIWGEGPVGNFHTEQICRVRGHFAIGDAIIQVSGVGARDHSAGKRDYGPCIGDLWFQCLFPDGDAIMVQVIHFEGLDVKASYYYPAGADAIEDLEILEYPTVAALDTPAGTLSRDPLADKDRDFVIRLRRRNGEEIRLDGRLLVSSAVTYRSPLEELQGTGEGAGLQLCECAAEIRWGDKIGYANRERSCRLSMFERQGSA